MSNEILLAILGTGGAVALLLTWGRSITDQILSDRVKRRTEWINEVETLRQRLDAAEAESDKWRERYFAQLHENATLQNRVTALELDLARLKQQMNGR